MLAQLTISNFTIVRELEIDFQLGMTAITGETGAGKSIAIDALNLCLGTRAEIDMVRPGADRADICVRFLLNDTPAAKHWLEENQLNNHNECLLRRTISADGRSRGFINGTAVPLSQLRELGQHLIQIHGQHTHQNLLSPEYQKKLLDSYANHPELLSKMHTAYQNWHQSCRELTQYQQQTLERESRRQLLDYQLKEMNEFAPQTGEYEKIDYEYNLLANSDQLISLSQQTLGILRENEQYNVSMLLQNAKQHINELIRLNKKLTPLSLMLEDGIIQLNEIVEELRHVTENTETNSSRMEQLEQRLSSQLILARKHHIKPEQLPELYQQLLAELTLLDQQETHLESLKKQVNEYHQQAIKTAKELHQQRTIHAEELAQEITHSIQTLAMPHGKMQIQVTFDPTHLTEEGACRISFKVTTNPGQPMQPLAKVASGGELSRIALAIQVITARKMETPALIFDEIDVGISGPTAAIVGQLLRRLGESTQVMCVTHLPQVAGNANQHLYVNKKTDGAITETQMHLLNKDERLQELARLLGGNQVTKNTLANARELLMT